MMLDPFTNGHHISKVKVKEQREEDPILSSYWHFGVNKKPSKAVGLHHFQNQKN
jgi:hypothetical protein